MSSLIPLRPDLVPFLDPYLPKRLENTGKSKIHVTLTYAASLDSRISAGKGIQTVISHPETKTMTHYIRAYHDAILVGISTVEADNPRLSCQYVPPDDNEPTRLIRPVIIDPKFRFNPTTSRMLELAKTGKGLGPFVVVSKNYAQEYPQKRLAIESSAGAIIEMSDSDLDINGQFKWNSILSKLYDRGIYSVMVEGGAKVINALLLQPELVSSLIVTIGPVYLGSNGVEVSPSARCRLKDVSWWKGIQDAVLAAHLDIGEQQ